MTNIRRVPLKPGEIIPLTFDFLFVAIFNKKENLIILENFLSDYFEVPLEEIKGKLTLKPRNLNLKSKKAANNQVNLILIRDNEVINIELSNKINDGNTNRNIVYACNIHSGNLKVGDSSYNKIHKTIQINLCNMKVNEELKETYYFRNEKGKILSKKIQIDFLDMVIGKEVCYTDSANKLARWCNIFTSKTEEEFKKWVDGLMEEEAVSKLTDEVNHYSADDEVVALYSNYTKEELERNTMLEDAEAKGKMEEKLEIAKNMLSENIDISLISKVTGLPKKQIEELKN